MIRSSSTRNDPSRDAASLLRRLGFIALFAGMPLVAFVAPSAVLALFPIAVLLLGSPALIAGALRPRPERVAGVSASTRLLAALVLVAWAGLSLAWTPNPREGAANLAALAVILAIAMTAYFALPERMRSANLYLIPIGTTAAAGIAVGLALSTTAADRAGALALERGLDMLVIQVWPSVAWLRSRGRDGEAVALAAVVAALAAYGGGPLPSAALAAGAFAYLLVQVAGRAGAATVGAAIAAVIVLAPLVTQLGPVLDVFAGFDAWRAALLGEPLRLLTGHGLAAWRGLGVPEAGPGTLLFGLWYDLGIVGVLAAAALAFAAIWSAAIQSSPRLGEVIAVIATAFAIFCAGPGSFEAWRVASLAATALGLVAIERGQSRTRRPRLAFLRRTRAS